MASPQDITNAFIKHYYQCFDSKNWAVLSGLYVSRINAICYFFFCNLEINNHQTKDSMLTFEGHSFKGTQPIVEKLQVGFL